MTLRTGLKIALGLALAMPVAAQQGGATPERRFGQPGGAPAAPAGGGGGNPLERIEMTEKAVREVATPDQKPKLEEIMKKAHAEIDPLKERLEKMEAERQEIMQKLREVGNATRNDVMAVLTDEQKAAIRQKLNAGGGGQAGGPAGGLMALLQSQMQNLNLTPEQQQKVATLRSDIQDKVAKLREKSGGDQQAMREGMRDVMQDVQSRLKDILTPEQVDKLQQALPRNGGAGDPGAGRPGAGGGNRQN